jgi:hypothetical protein
LPWAIPYLLPSEKWLPIHWPPEDWQVRDGTVPMEAPVPPPGRYIHWWLLPKDQWPFSTPWEEKQLGAWSSFHVQTDRDLVNHPPFGYINLKMLGQQITSGNAITWHHMNAHMGFPYPSPFRFHHKFVMALNTPMGAKFYVINKNWVKFRPDIDEPKIDQQEFYQHIGNRRDMTQWLAKQEDAKKRRAIERAKARERYKAMLAAEIEKTGGVPKPSVDLFT